jgi:hypothetical protein
MNFAKKITELQEKLIKHGISNDMEENAFNTVISLSQLFSTGHSYYVGKKEPIEVIKTNIKRIEKWNIMYTSLYLANVYMTELEEELYDFYQKFLPILKEIVEENKCTPTP